MISYAAAMQESYKNKGNSVRLEELLLRLRRSGAGGQPFAEQILAMLEYDPGLRRRIAAKDLALLEKYARKDYAQGHVPSGPHGGEFTSSGGNIRGMSDQSFREKWRGKRYPDEDKETGFSEQRRADRLKGQSLPENIPSWVQGHEVEDFKKLPEYAALQEASAQHHGLPEGKRMFHWKHLAAAGQALKAKWGQMKGLKFIPEEHKNVFEQLHDINFMHEREALHKLPEYHEFLAAQRTPEYHKHDIHPAAAKASEAWRRYKDSMPKPEAKPSGGSAGGLGGLFAPREQEQQPRLFAQSMHDSWQVNYDAKMTRGTFGEKGRFLTVEHGGEKHVIFIPAKQQEAKTRAGQHKQELAKSKATNRAEWHAKAKEAGITPSHLHSFVKEMLRADTTANDQVNAMLSDARAQLSAMSRTRGYKQTHKMIGASQGRGSKGSIEDATQIRGLDEVADSMARKYPELFRQESGEHGSIEDQLFAMLEGGKRGPLSEEDAYRHGLDYLYERKRKEEADNPVPFQEPPVPTQIVYAQPPEPPQFSRLAGLFAELATFLKPEPPVVHVHPQITLQPNFTVEPKIDMKPEFKPEIIVQSPQQPAPIVNVAPPKVSVKVERQAQVAMQTEILYDDDGKVRGKIERPYKG